MDLGDGVGPKQCKGSVVVGWIAIALTTTISSLCAYWGSMENFHEGWYYHELWRNLALMLVQYLSWMFIFMIAGLAAVWNRVVGAIIHALFAASAFWLFGFRSPAATIWIIIPVLILGSIYYFGRPTPIKWARRCLIAIPLLTAAISSAFSGWRVLTRPASVDYSARQIMGSNGVNLIWAPAGPGWSDKGLPWQEAQARCKCLNHDGQTLSSEPVGVWRLPTVDEAVQSMIWRGQNAGGEWDAQASRARYRVMPDKEAPLWNRYSQIIYWWTATEQGTDRAYRIAYNGYVSLTPKEARWGYLGCRCVRDPED
jgi:hypothetical protein